MSEPEHRVVPLPSSFELREGSLPITALTRIVIADEHEHDHQHDQTVNHLIGDVQRATGIHLARTATAAAGDIELRLDGDPGQLGPEGYALDIDEHGATVRAATPHGVWNGTRTLVQLLPHTPLDTSLPFAHILDRPRYEWRGVMLDVARHFFGVDQVLRFIELIARCKLNRLHLHLTDDQGWRIAIDGWPALTGVGGSTGASGSAGGYFTRAD